MQTIKTWSLRVAIGGLILIFLLAVGVYFSMNFLVEQAIEREGARATGVEVSLEEASVGFDGSGELSGLRMYNPDNPGFDSDWFMNLDRVTANVRPGSVFEPVVDIPNVHLDGLKMTIERNNDEENYLVILNQIQERLETAGKTEGAGWEFKIQKLKVTGIEITFSGFPGMNRTLKLADIHMEDVGSKEDPLTLTRMLGLIFKTMFSQLLTNPEMIPGTVVAGLNEGLRGLEDLGDVTVKFAGNVTDEAGNVLSDVGGAAETAIDDVGGAIEGIFGGGDDNEEEE